MLCGRRSSCLDKARSTSSITAQLTASSLVPATPSHAGSHTSLNSSLQHQFIHIIEQLTASSLVPATASHTHHCTAHCIIACTCNTKSCRFIHITERLTATPIHTHHRTAHCIIACTGNTKSQTSLNSTPQHQFTHITEQLTATPVHIHH